MSKKILFLVAHRPGRSPGQRFRFEQYLGFLQENGFSCHVSFLLNEKDDKIFYARGKYLAKLILLLKSIRMRLSDLKQARKYDLVFLYREAHMLGFPYFEKQLKRMDIPMVVDFDDSIWLKDISDGNKNVSFLKKPSKTPHIIQMMKACIVGNQYLHDYAKQYCEKVFIIPTTIDTSVFKPSGIEKLNEHTVCIGWTGSSTTIKHFSLAVPVLRKLKEKYGKKVCFRLISDTRYNGLLEDLEFVRWRKETEVEDLDKIDIGIMPLPDDPWSRGKCGFKGLQYMSLGKPAVMSPVGVNTEIIDHGENGFLANSQQEWEQILSNLIENEQLRRDIGRKGQETVQTFYSFNAMKQRYLEIFRQLTET